MKKKIIGIFIVILLIGTAVLPVQGLNKLNNNYINYIFDEITNSDIPNDFELTGIAGGIAPWTKLFKLEINSNGETKYYWMYPEDRGNIKWTLKNEFIRSSIQMDEIWDEMEDNDFFNLNSLYEKPNTHDGTYAQLDITGNGQSNKARTVNIAVSNFDAIVKKINDITPGSSDLFYNALCEAELNDPPYKPDKPFGETNVEIGNEYEYFTSGSEPEYDNMWYLFSWGDDTDSGWLGPYKAGQNVSSKHSWSSKGNYEIKVKAKDEYDSESEWSDPLSISLPKTKQKNIVFFHEIIDRLLKRIPIFQKIIK